METLIHVAESAGIAVVILAFLVWVLADEWGAQSAKEPLPEREAVGAVIHLNELAFAAERALFDAAVEAKRAEDERRK